MAIKHITDQKTWDIFIDENPNSLIYHKWHFLKLVEKYTGYELLPYGIFKGEQLICVFPLFLKKIMGVKLLFSPPPQSGIPYLGPVVDRNFKSLKQDKKESLLDYILQEIDGEINKIAPNYISVILVPEFHDIRPFLWRNYKAHPGYTYTIGLERELDEIWNGFTSLCRHNIRKGEELKCELRKCDGTSVLTDLLTERYRGQGLNHGIDPAYLREALEIYPENLELDCLFDQDELVGATLNQAYNRYLGWMGLPKPKDKKYFYVNELMIWLLVRRAKSLGFNKLEMSGANKQSLCQYRSKFNPELEMYFTITKKDFFGKLAEAFYRNLIKKNVRFNRKK